MRRGGRLHRVLVDKLGRVAAGGDRDGTGGKFARHRRRGRDGILVHVVVLGVRMMMHVAVRATTAGVAGAAAVAAATVSMSALQPAEQVQSATGVAGVACRGRFAAAGFIVAVTRGAAAEELVQPTAVRARIARGVASRCRIAASGFSGAAALVAKPVAGEQTEALARGAAAHRLLVARVAG